MGKGFFQAPKQEEAAKVKRTARDGRRAEAKSGAWGEWVWNGSGMGMEWVCCDVGVPHRPLVTAIVSSRLVAVGLRPLTCQLSSSNEPCEYEV